MLIFLLSAFCTRSQLIPIAQLLLFHFITIISFHLRAKKGSEIMSPTHGCWSWGTEQESTPSSFFSVPQTPKKQEGGLIIQPLRFRESTRERRGARFRLKICFSVHSLSPPECNFLDQELANIFKRGGTQQIFFGFVSHIVSVTMTQLCHGNMKAPQTVCQQIEGAGCAEGGD